MKNNSKMPFSTLEGYTAKDKKFWNELQTIFHFLKENVATATMVHIETGIEQKNITRYKRDLEKGNLLWEVERNPCKITGCKAWYLTTDRNKVLIIN